MMATRTAGNERLSLLLDFGGQSCQALVVDGCGELIARSEHANLTHQDGVRVELDGEAIVTGFRQLLSTIDDELKVKGLQVAQATLAVQRGSVIAWDRGTGEPLGPMLSWRDRRSAETSGLEPEQAEWVRQRTGLRWSPYAGAPKMRWLVDHLELVRHAAEEQRLALGPAGSFLLTRLLSGQPFLTDDSLAQRTLLWSHQHMDWDKKLLATFGLTGVVLPQVRPSRFEYGRLASVSGHPPLRLLIGDQNAIPFLTGRPDPDGLYVNLGTGGFVLRPIEGIPDTDRFQLSLLSRDDGGRFALEGSIHGAATALNWLAERSDRAFKVEQIDDLCQQVRRPPLFINTLDGLGSPWWSDGGEPAFVETKGACEKGLASQARAIIESIVFLIRANLEAMNEHLAAPKRIVLSGGLSRSRVLRQCLADGLGLPVQVLEDGEGTVMGSWCMLDPQHVLPDSAWCRLTPAPDQGLEARYRDWLERIELRAD
jgi:glycerol kinase